MLSLKSLSPSGVSLFKVLSRIQSWKQTCFHPYLQNVFYQSHQQKDVNPQKLRGKVNMRQGSSCTLVNKTKIKNVSSGHSRYTTLSLASQPAKPQKKIQITFKNNKFYEIENSECAWTHTIEKAKSICY